MDDVAVTASAVEVGRCELLHHGAAASSSPNSILWISDEHDDADADAAEHVHDSTGERGACSSSYLLYPSHGVLNLAVDTVERAAKIGEPDDDDDGGGGDHDGGSGGSYSTTTTGLMSVSETFRGEAPVMSSPLPTAGSGPSKTAATSIATSQSSESRMITCLCRMRSYHDEKADGGEAVAAGHANGAVSLWHRRRRRSRRSFEEDIVVAGGGVVGGGGAAGASIAMPSVTDAAGMTGIPISAPSDGDHGEIRAGGAEADVIATASALGVNVRVATATSTLEKDLSSEDASLSSSASSRRWYRQTLPFHHNSPAACRCVMLRRLGDDVLLLTGSAAPRNNRIRVYLLTVRVDFDDSSNAETDAVAVPMPVVQCEEMGSGLLGHQGWVDCMDWLSLDGDGDCDDEEGGGGHLLASGSHDARIRLWRFHPPRRTVDVNATTAGGGEDEDEEGEGEEDEDDEGHLDALLDASDDGARLVVRHRPSSDGTATTTTTAVTLEALLVGHDDTVTSVSWRPRGKDERPCLLSSSMDRSILIWASELTDEDDDDGGVRRAIDSNGGGGGVWVPLTRVGSAGGMLGASPGSSLLGYVGATWDPSGNRIVGHGYGGSLQFWTLITTMTEGGNETRTEKEDEGGVDTARKSTRRKGALPFDDDRGNFTWRADPCLTGHFRGVTDCSWEPTRGEYLLSVGSDQTCRLWAPLRGFVRRRDDGGGTDDGGGGGAVWHEVGRPQVHGYDLSAVECVGVGVGVGVGGGGGGTAGEDAEGVTRPPPPHRFVSGADEKQLRVFDAPVSTLRLLDRAAGRGGRRGHRDGLFSGGENVGGGEVVADGGGGGDASDTNGRVERAYLPSLGLSNKAAADEGDKDAAATPRAVEGDGDDDGAAEATGVSSIVRDVPLERELGVSTLWPEVQKLYGHGSELVCIASTARRSCFVRIDEGGASPPTPPTEESMSGVSGGGGTDVDGRGELVEDDDDRSVIVASSCKARDVEQAAIRLWDVVRGTCVGVLEGGHQSTVTTLSFSDDGKFLASSGKDRRLCIWQRRKGKHSSLSIGRHLPDYVLVAALSSAHRRILWSCHFCPQNPTMLATGARDGLVKIWKITEAEEEERGEGQITEMFSFRPSCEGKKTEPVTAVSFSPQTMQAASHANAATFTDAILAIGLECGLIEIWAIPTLRCNVASSSSSCRLLRAIHPADCHVGAVRKLAWRPCCKTFDHPNNDENVACLTLASCGSDHGVRIFGLEFHAVLRHR